MPRPFEVQLPLEKAYSRNVLFAAQVIDAVTLEPVTRGVDVSVTGLTGRPVVNNSGYFVFLEERAGAPQKVHVRVTRSPYEDQDVAAPVPPARLVRIELAPRVDYPFGAGVTALRGSLIESGIGARVPVTDAEVWLRWIDDDANGTTWIDVPTHSHTGASGDFACFVRLAPKQSARLTAAGRMRLQLRGRRAGNTLTSLELSIPPGRVADALPPFAWDTFVP